MFTVADLRVFLANNVVGLAAPIRVHDGSGSGHRRDITAIAVRDDGGSEVILRLEPEPRRQVWFCSTCGALGVYVFAPPAADVMSVATAMHTEHGDASPSCRAEPQVVVLENIAVSALLRAPTRLT